MTDGKKYVIETVWQDISAELKEEVTEFWLENRAVVNRRIAERRIPQVCFIARNTEGYLIGVSTVYKKYNKQLENNFYYLRAFVKREYRDLDIGREFTWGVTRYFEEKFLTGEDPEVIGMFMEVENRFFHRHRRQAVYMDEKWGFTKNGYVYIGKDTRGYHLRVYYFKGAEI